MRLLPVSTNLKEDIMKLKTLLRYYCEADNEDIPGMSLEDREIINTYNPKENYIITFENERVLNIDVVGEDATIITLQGIEHLGEYDIEDFDDVEVSVYKKVR